MDEKTKVYAGLVYMGDDVGEYKEIFIKKYGKKAELRNFSYDMIHQYRAELYVTQDILDKDFDGRPKLIS